VPDYKWGSGKTYASFKQVPSREKAALLLDPGQKSEDQDHADQYTTVPLSVNSGLSEMIRERKREQYYLAC
jgi:hypothetical protein